MKLEAVDRKNPHFICPATVGALRGVEVLVTFDGWRGAFDYYCRYDSRDIFPVGWCNLTGDNLQPPGTKGLDRNSRRGGCVCSSQCLKRYLCSFTLPACCFIRQTPLERCQTVCSCEKRDQEMNLFLLCLNNAAPPIRF